MNPSNRTLLSGIAALCLALFFGGAADAANSSESADSASSSSSSANSASSNASRSPRPRVLISGPAGKVVVGDAGVEITAAEPPQPPGPPMPPWNPGKFGNVGNNAVVSIGHDSNLAEGERADSVVSVLGSSTSAGDVSDSVVSVLGDTRVTGPVGDAVVAVLGTTYVNSEVHGDVVAVLGDVELGPQANVGGEVVAVGGAVKRDPAAVVHGGVQNVAFGTHVNFKWLRAWVDNCLLYGRMLAFAPGLGWAWTLALVSLLLYVFTAMLFRTSVEKCVQTLETQPGQSILAALLTTVMTPIVMVLLAITVIGILAIPFIGVALLIADSFGKLAMLAWIGRRVTRGRSEGAMAHPAFAVLIGGVIVTLLYCIPVLGFVTYKMLGFVGLGVVIYTLLLQMRSRREAQRAATLNKAGASAAAPTMNTAAEIHANPGVGSASSEQSAASDAPQAEPVRPTPISPVAALAYPRAGYGVRMAALLLDVILISVLLHFVIHSQRVHLLTLAAYGAVMWKLKGTTIGGILFNLQVVRLDGREIDWATSIVRALSCFLSLFIAALGFIWIAFDEEKQAWHDKIAGTVVVRVPKGVSLL